MLYAGGDLEYNVSCKDNGGMALTKLTEPSANR